MKIFKSTKKQFQEIIKKIQIIVMNLITMSLENWNMQKVKNSLT